MRKSTKPRVDRSRTDQEVKENSDSKVKINGHSTDVKSFLSDPKSHLSKPIPQEYLNEVTQDIETQKKFPKMRNYDLEKSTKKPTLPKEFLKVEENE